MSNFDAFFPFNRPVEKSWSPTLSDDSGNFATMGAISGESLKFGNYVWITFGIVTASIAGLTGTDPLLIKGLPYSPSLGSTVHFNSMDNLVLIAGDSLPKGYIDEINFPDSIAMQYLQSDNTSGDTVFPVNKWSDTGTVIGSGFYITAD